MSERKEAWMRIPVGIIAGIILGLWKTLVAVLALFHFIYVAIVGKRVKGLSNF